MMNHYEQDPGFYEKVLQNFDTFCDQFESAAARRFAGLDNDSRQPIDNAEIQRVTPIAVREIDDGGEEGVIVRTPPIDVQAPPVPELHEVE